MTATSKRRKSLAAIVGAGCTAILCAQVPSFEGMVLRGYEDPIGIVTACAGHTKTAVLGKPYTPEECEVLLQDDLVEHAEGVLECAPTLEGKTGPLAAAVSFTFNVGTGAFCRSTMARKFNAGDIAGGCAELSRWINAGGKPLKGLIKRRASERAICESEL
jgi:lysozyme